jgi:hypothetical protein
MSWRFSLLEPCLGRLQEHVEQLLLMRGFIMLSFNYFIGVIEFLPLCSHLLEFEPVILDLELVTLLFNKLVSFLLECSLLF